MTDRCEGRWILGWLCCLFAFCLPFAGCGNPENPASLTKPPPPSAESPSAAQPTEPTSSDQSTAAQPAVSSSDTPAASAHPEEPFHRPATLVELDKTIEWEDRPVRDSMKLLTDDLAKNPLLVSVEQALAMKNDSTEDNQKILSVLGRLPAGNQQPNWNANITRYLIMDMNSMNPILVDTAYEMWVAQIYVPYIIAFDWNMQPYADADFVEHWQSSKDHMCDKITLRRDCTWSDGKPFTAHDIEYSFHAIMNQKIPVLAVRTNCDKLRDVVAYDDYTVVFFQREPLVTNVWNLDYPMIPQHIYEPLYSQLDKISFEELQNQPEYQKYELHPISCQAYECVGRTRNQEIVFRRNDSWYLHDGKQVRAKPFFQEVRFRIVEDPNTALLALKLGGEAGGLDEYEIQQDQWASQTDGPDFYNKNTKSFGTEWTYFYYGWNNNEPSAPFFKDRRVREAMSYAVDYHELLHTLLHGLCEQCTCITHPTAWYAPKIPLKPYVQDLDKAEALLNEAGWVDSDGDGIRDKLVDGQRVKFAFSIICKNDPERVAICQLLQNNLAQLGIQCDIQKMEGTRLFDRLNKKQYQACFAGWGCGTDPDEDENVWATKYIKGGRNDLQYSNPEVDRLFQEGRREFDQEKRAAIYAKIDELIYNDQPCTFLYWRNSLWGWNKQLRGYRFSPRDPYNYFPGFMSIWNAAE
ncbi:MAG TPA: ABC transporter substrate-binding protein [Pirellulales bacterium]